MKQKILVCLTVFFLVFVGTGCNQQSNSPTTIEGVVTAVDEEKSFIYIDGRPIVVNRVSSYEVGQKAKAELIDTSREKSWNPQDMIVKKVEVSKE